MDLTACSVCRFVLLYGQEEPETKKKTKAEMNTSRGEKVKRPEMKLREGSTQSAIITLRKVISKKSNV